METKKRRAGSKPLCIHCEDRPIAGKKDEEVRHWRSRFCSAACALDYATDRAMYNEWRTDLDGDHYWYPV